MPVLTHRPLASLPTTTLPWLELRDHFVATVGPHSGQGRPLGSLLVLADATFAPRSRFPLHPHRDMEILSVVIDGTLSHHGDQAQGATLGARSAQLISSRSGMVHAEGNDTDQSTRMLQIWFQPRTQGGAPAYFHRELGAPGPSKQLVAGDEAMPLRTDARVWWVDVAPARTERLAMTRPRKGYLLAMTTALRVKAGERVPAVQLATGEGLGVEEFEGEIEVSGEGVGAALWIEVG